MSAKRIVVIGSGFSSVSAATELADKGYEVTILEKNLNPGGRARSFHQQGFTFDMGPSWYWMPDVFNSYFSRYQKSTSDYYSLVRLNPSYKIVFDKDDFMEVPADLNQLKELFNSFEQGSGQKLESFLLQAKVKYEVGLKKLAYKPGRSITEYLSLNLLLNLFKLDILQSFHRHIRKYFSHKKLLQLMEFPILFLGAVPQNTPALYSLMNYADIMLGTWYPMGGMHKIVEGMVSLAKEKGVRFVFGEKVEKIVVQNGKAVKALTAENAYDADIVVGGADYHHIENSLLDKEYQSYSPQYWDSRVLAPSSLIFYLAIGKKVSGLSHHTLFFDTDFKLHAEEIYSKPSWPTNPLFYVSAPSVTDPGVAPSGCENLFILVPVAPGLQDNEDVRERYFNLIMDRLEYLTGENIKDSIIFKRSYAHNDFISDYHAYKGNAYGLANTLMQTAILKPSLKSRKVDNLYFTGQLTVPGPGVPPSIISGLVVANEIHKQFN